MLVPSLTLRRCLLRGGFQHVLLCFFNKRTSLFFTAYAASTKCWCLLRRLAIVLSPVQNARRFVLPPTGAAFLERSACTIPTVSALPDLVRPLNLQLSVSLLCRLTLAIVLSPVQNALRFVLPPEGAATMSIVLLSRGAE